MSILQDVENSLTLARLNVLQSRKIRPEDLLKAFSKNQLPNAIPLENIMLLEKKIDIECYILNNQINYLLQVPITHKSKLIDVKQNSSLFCFFV